MALATLQGYATTAMDNTAWALKQVGAGAKGWLKNSDVTWISTAVAYGATKVATDEKWIAGMNPNYAAAFVFIASSIYGIAQAILPAKDAKDPAVSDLPNRNLILVTNTLAASLIVAHRLKLDVTNYTTGLVAAASYAVVSMVHGSYYK